MSILNWLMNRREVEPAASVERHRPTLLPVVATDSFAALDVGGIFAEAQLNYGSPNTLLPIGTRFDIPMTDENTDLLSKQYGPEIVIVGHKLRDGGLIDMELIGAQVALKVLPEICRGSSHECFGIAKTFEELGGEERAELASFSLGRRGTDKQERKHTRRRRLCKTLVGRLRLGTEDALGQLAGTITNSVTSGRDHS
jgi:hypothetical protein